MSTVGPIARDRSLEHAIEGRQEIQIPAYGAYRGSLLKSEPLALIVSMERALKCER